MKKLIILNILLIALIGSLNAQKAKITGSWLVTKVEIGTETQYPYQNFNYNEDGKMVVMGIEVGSWEFNKNNNSISMKSEFDKDFNGEGKVLILTENKKVVLKDGTKVYYHKIDASKIIKENESSGLIGTWKLANTNSESIKILEFKAPDEFVLVEKNQGYQSKSKGNWIFNKNEKTVILIGFSLEHLKGVNKVISISTDEIILDNYGTIYSLKKEESQTAKIERLTFSQGDFYDENEEFKYDDDSQKLPWNDFYKMMTDLSNIKQLVYNCSSLIKGTNSFETKILTANVMVNEKEEVLSIDNIFNGYDSYNLPEDTAFPSNEYDQYNQLYPLEDNTYRFVGYEDITTPAGTFNCTVLEVLSDANELKKVWMIDNKFGVYAKIIDENTDEMFGYYRIYELQEIK